VRPVLGFSGVALSHAGLVRSGNEDSGFMSSSCMLVADGVGGAAAGEVASATAAYVVSALALTDPRAEPVAMLREGIVLAQHQVAAGVRQDPARAGMATTLTALATDGATFAVAHVGDSRGYVLRGGRLTRITVDHTFVQRLVEEGTLGEEDVPSHPWRHVVLRSIDGTAAERDIEATLARHHDDAAVESLLDVALAAGGRDNITCVLATVLDLPEVETGLLVGAARDPRNVVDAAAVRMPHSA